jgi:hypothetical protein
MRDELIALIKAHAAVLRYPSEAALLDDMCHSLKRKIEKWDDLTDAELAQIEAKLDGAAAPHR